MQVQIQIVKLSISLAEVHFQLVDPAEGELKGIMVGPRCRGRSTIEIAYSMRPLSEPGSAKVVIPEPSLWSEMEPFEYVATLECWQGGQQMDRTTEVIRLHRASWRASTPKTSSR